MAAWVQPLGVEAMTRPGPGMEKAVLLENPTLPRNPSPVRDWIKTGVWGMGLGNLFGCLGASSDSPPTRSFDLGLSYLERAFSLNCTEVVQEVESAVEKVAFAGVPGSHSEAAALQMDQDFETQPCSTYDEALQKLAQGEVDCAVLPVENSLDGPVEGLYERIPSYPNAHIVGEIAYKVDHCLVALPGVDKHSIRKVYSHEQALVQCSNFLQANNFEPVPFEGTAGAAELLKKNDLRTSAALSSRRAAQVHGLNILEPSVQDTTENATRFVLLSNKPAPHPDSFDLNPEEHRVTPMFTLKPGVSLSKVLSVFAGLELDVENVESRPVMEAPIVEGLAGRRFHRRFFVDVTGSMSEPLCKLALDRVQEFCREFRVLGSYARDLSL